MTAPAALSGGRSTVSPTAVRCTARRKQQSAESGTIGRYGGRGAGLAREALAQRLRGRPRRPRVLERRGAGDRTERWARWHHRYAGASHSRRGRFGGAQTQRSGRGPRARPSDTRLLLDGDPLLPRWPSRHLSGRRPEELSAAASRRPAVSGHQDFPADVCLVDTSVGVVLARVSPAWLPCGRSTGSSVWLPRPSCSRWAACARWLPTMNATTWSATSPSRNEVRPEGHGAAPFNGTSAGSRCSSCRRLSHTAARARRRPTSWRAHRHVRRRLGAHIGAGADPGEPQGVSHRVSARRCGSRPAHRSLGGPPAHGRGLLRDASAAHRG